MIPGKRSTELTPKSGMTRKGSELQPYIRHVPTGFTLDKDFDIYRTRQKRPFKLLPKYR